MKTFESKQTALLQECYDHIEKVVKDNHTSLTYYTPYEQYEIWFGHLRSFMTKPIVLNNGTIVTKIIVQKFVHSAQILIHTEHNGWYIEELQNNDVITIADKLTEMFNL